MLRKLLPALLLLSVLGCESAPDRPENFPPQRPAAESRRPPSIDPDPGPPKELAEGPKLLFTAPGHEYGRMEKNTRASHTAVFYNAGDEDLRIEMVKTHCGCAAALLSSKSIGPGERGTLKVTMSSGTLPGRRVKTVEVYSNDPAAPVSRYVISCDVIADVALDPISLVVRATRNAGPVTAHFDVLSLRPGFDLEVMDIQTHREDLTSELEILPEKEGRRGFRVHLKFGPSFANGDFHERVTVTTNSDRDPRLTLSVLGSLRQSVLVVPERLYFPRLKSGESVSRSLYVYRTDGRPLVVIAAEDAAGLFEIETKRMEPTKWEVKVTVAGEAPQTTVRGTIVIVTDDPQDERLPVQFELPGEDDS